jgi:Zn-dependent protease
MLGLDPATLIARIIVLVITFTIHELAHAWTATQLGDETPRLNGRLTFNPLAHLDPMGSLLLLFAGFGWAKPVPINPYALNRRTPAGVMWVSLAGPFSNLLMAILAAVPIRMGLIAAYGGLTTTSAILPTVPQIFDEFIYINLLLCLFNLIPLAPLDGEKIVDFSCRPAWPKCSMISVLMDPSS